MNAMGAISISRARQPGGRVEVHHVVQASLERAVRAKPSPPCGRARSPRPAHAASSAPVVGSGVCKRTIVRLTAFSINWRQGP